MVSMILTKLQLSGERNGLDHGCYTIAMFRGEEWYSPRLLQHGPLACFRIFSFESAPCVSLCIRWHRWPLAFQARRLPLFWSVSPGLCLTVSSPWMPTPAIAQLVEHLTVDRCSHQMVPGSIPGGWTFARNAVYCLSTQETARMRTPGIDTGSQVWEACMMMAHCMR